MFASSARADEPALPVDLVWDAPAECPDREDVLRRVASLLGADAASRAHVAAHGTIARTGEDSFRLELETRTGDLLGVRTIDAVTCSSLAKAAAVVITVALSSWQPSPSDGVPLESEPAPRSKSPAPRPRSDAARAPVATALPMVAWTMGAAGVLEAGALPKPMAGVALTTALDIRWLRLGASGALYAPRHVTFSTPVASTVRFDMWTLGGSACGLFEWHRARLGPCAEMGAMFVHVLGIGLANARAADVTQPIAAAGAILDVELNARVRAFVHPNVKIPLAAKAIGVRTDEGAVMLNDLSMPALRVSFGLDVRLW
ncbi:MAG: hypothetical protein BGO98_42845 [Myxococcales bacterium 68-20]|nr:hypothetical protein [Myxococcales bacterium]OJY29135.1 MAG: hypothetical protein BGO98_42845 [Myxococcales bacterium 68-20]